MLKKLTKSSKDLNQYPLLSTHAYSYVLRPNCQFTTLVKWMVLKLNIGRFRNMAQEKRKNYSHETLEILNNIA